MSIYRDQLEAVYRLIEDEKRWTQDASARDEQGNFVDSRHPNAVSWCLRGACWKAIADFDGCLTDQLDVPSVINFNDSHTHAEVLALLTSAIERAPVRGVS